ncbi:MAG: transcription termination factor Rho [Lachnospiraceae bacterium]|nr:transcription termination factor Rho [Lachnospiraceae bacterium]
MMTKEKYQTLNLPVLRTIAKDRGMKGTSTMKKGELIEALVARDLAEEQASSSDNKNSADLPWPHMSERTAAPIREERAEAPVREERAAAPVREENGSSRPRYENGGSANAYGGNQGEKRPYTGRANTARGILEVMQDGYGFLRSDNFLPGEDDVYVSPSQIRRFNLKTGDIIEGNKREKAQGEKYGALLYVGTVNDFPAEEAKNRMSFENMTPIFPNERIRLERPDGSRATRIVDLICPIGKGQRGMIVSPPKAGKTTLLKDVAKSILTATPDANLIILLIDERPEEVTDIKESVVGKNVEVIYSTFDESPDHHRRVSEMVIERAKRLVEHKQDVIILLDSITRLARAYNVLVAPSGRTLSGGLDPNALLMPKRFFGAARNMREGGSLTILATALVDTGSKMDDVVYEEFKGTGNMELILDRKLQERRIFPAIDIVKSGTRREDLLLSAKEQKAVDLIRRRVNGLKAEESVEFVLNAFSHYKTNEIVVNAILAKWQQP